MTAETYRRLKLRAPNTQNMRGTSPSSDHSGYTEASSDRSTEFTGLRSKSCSQSSRRRISIREDLNEAYSNTQTTKDECRALWYDGEDLKNFKKEAIREAKKIIRSTEPAHEAWRKGMLNAYNAFSQARSVNELNEALQRDAMVTSHDPVLTGMYKWVLRPIVEQSQARRRHLYAIIARCKTDSSSSRSTRNKFLRKASRDISCPGRLFAHHMALMSVEVEY